MKSATKTPLIKRKRDKKALYKKYGWKYMLIDTPVWTLLLLFGTVFLSAAYKLLIASDVFRLFNNVSLLIVTFCSLELLLLFGYWYGVFRFAKSCRHRVRNLTDYYLMFGIVSAVFVVFCGVLFTQLDKEQYSWLLRLTLNLCGLRLQTEFPERRGVYLFAFLLITVLIIMLEPIIAQKQYQRIKNHRTFKDYIKALSANSPDADGKVNPSYVAFHTPLRVIFLFIGTMLFSVVYRVMIRTGVFDLIFYDTARRIVFCIFELLLLLGYWYGIFLFSKTCRHRTRSVIAYYKITGIVAAAFAVVCCVLLVVLPANTYAWLLQITLNLSGARMQMVSDSRAPWLLAFLVVTAFIMLAEPIVSQKRYERFKKKREAGEIAKMTEDDEDEEDEAEEVDPLYMLISTPLRAIILLGGTILISAAYKLLIEIGFLNFVYDQTAFRIVYCGFELLLLLAYWVGVYLFSQICRERSHSVGAYYLMTGIVATVFVTFCSVALARLETTGLYSWLLRVTLNLCGARLETLLPPDCTLYLAIFLLITVLIMLAVPIVSNIRYRSYLRMKELVAEEEREAEEAEENADEFYEEEPEIGARELVLNPLWRSIVVLVATVLVSAVYQLVVNSGVFDAIYSSMVRRLLFCGFELLVLLGYWFFVFRFSKACRHRSPALDTHYLTTGIVVAVVSIVFVVMYFRLSREMYSWLFGVTLNLAGVRLRIPLPTHRAPYLFFFLIVTGAVMMAEPFLAQKRYERFVRMKELQESDKDLIWNRIDREE